MENNIDHKQKGNEYFKQSQYEKAKDEYSKAIKNDPKNGVLFSNRSFAFLRLEQFGYARDDATEAINYGVPKGYYRRGCALLALGHFKLALKDFKNALHYFPNNKDAIKKKSFCEAEIRQAILAEAIQNINTIPISERINLDKIPIDEKYDGLKFETPISKEFVEKLMQYLKEEKRLHKKFVCQIIIEALRIFKKEPTLIFSNVPQGCTFTVCGDIHGQYYDLINIFKINGLPSKNNIYLFNGDIVDRGVFSVECIILLLSFKILFPNSFYINRGNHESFSMNKLFGFENEVLYKYDNEVYELFGECFVWMPLAHVLSNKVFITHGGLFSQDNIKLEQISAISRNIQPPDSGLMCELLWSDPMDLSGRTPSKRGVAINFGADVTENFLKTNNLDLVIRSHEVKMNGYEFNHNDKLITVFSAPNYCDTMTNKGAFIRFTEDLKYEAITFEAVGHPPVMPLKYASAYA